ncbi:MAG TPA: hypothetical protein VGH27_21505 [Streptosporangiaceae bacterium]|jgi:hypothetical protein
MVRMVRSGWHGPAIVITVAAVAAASPGRALAGTAVTAKGGADTAGVITTVAGGVGGPGAATSVPLAVYGSGPCSVTSGDGPLYVGDGVVRRIDGSTGQLTTVAGTAAPSPLGTGGPATAAIMQSCGVAKDQNGNLIVTNDLTSTTSPEDPVPMVEVVAGATGTFYGQAMTKGDIYPIAGGGDQKIGEGQLATQVYLADPQSVTVDQHGNVIFADEGDGGPAELDMIAETTGTFYKHTVTPGHIYRLAGDYKCSSCTGGDGGPAIHAELGSYASAQVDSVGNIVLADTAGTSSPDGRVQVIAAKTGTFYGVAMTKGDIYSVAGGGTGGLGDGGPALDAELTNPQGLAIDTAGNLIVADTADQRIRVVAAATGTFYGQAMTKDDIYTVAGNGTAGFSGDGGPATAAELNDPVSVAVNGMGGLLVADEGNQRVRLVAETAGTSYGQTVTAGNIYTVAGEPSPTGVPCCVGDQATASQLVNPRAVAVDQAGNTVFSEGTLYPPRGPVVQVKAARTGTFYGQSMTAGGLYTVVTSDMDGSSPIFGITVDSAGNLVLADTNGNKILVLAATTGMFYGQSMTAGDVYTVAGTGAAGLSGNRGPATAATLRQPFGTALDLAGNLLIADTGNNQIRVVAESNGTFYGKAMTAGDIYEVAGTTRGFAGDGGPAASAELNAPEGVSVDAEGNLVIGDATNDRIRVVAAHTGTFYGQAMTTGDIYTVAGGGTKQTANGIPATSAELNNPGQVAIDGAGNLAFSDGYDELIRVVAEATGTFYGRGMTAGDVYTVAGNGTFGFSGDGGPGTAAEVADPTDVAVDSAGDLLIADSGSNRIRQIGE